MANQFQGTVNLDIRDSVPDWVPFEAPRAPEGSPNVVYIVLDDVGFSAMSPYGGPVPMPNIERIAAMVCATRSGTRRPCARRPAHVC